MDPYLLKRLWRRPWLSLCSLILSGVFCFLLGFLTDYRQNQQQKLLKTQEDFPISCVVTDIRGTKSVGLRMDAAIAEFVTGEDSPMHGLVQQVLLTKEFTYSIPALGIPDRGSLTSLVGVSHPQCANKLDTDMGAQVTWLTEDFFESDQLQLVLPETLYLQLQEMPQLQEEPLTLMVTDPCVNPNFEPELATQPMEFQVAGYYAGGSYGIYMPYNAAQKMEGEYFRRNTCDSISFLAADNLALDALSQTASQVFGVVDPTAPAFSQEAEGVALTIHDEQYRATVAALTQNIQRTGYLLPVVLLLGIGVGFLVSFLSTRSEKRTYALMRTMGMTRGKLFFSILREQLVLVALAVLIALAITRESIPAVSYFVCYAVGCVASVMKSIQVPPSAILREQE